MIRKNFRRLLASFPVLDGLFRRLIWSRIHFPENEIRLLNQIAGRPFDIAVDVGSALGSYTWVLNRIAHDVIAFEPGKKHYEHVRAASALSRVTIVNAAVGAREGQGELITPGQTNEGRHMATLSSKNPIAQSANVIRDPVRIISLDQHLDAHFSSDRRLDLLKIDVEGFENSVLEGGYERIKRDLPIIIAEVEARHNPNYFVFFEKLLDLGYTCYGCRNNEYVPFSAYEVGRQTPPNDITNGDDYSYVNNFVFEHSINVKKIVKQ